MNVIHLGHRRRFLLNATALTVLIAVVATAVTTWVGTAVASTSSQQATLVTVATVIQKNVTAWDDFSGRLEAVDRVEIKSRVSGTIQAVHFREGAIVKTGELLFTIDDAPYRAELERSGAKLTQAQAHLQNAQSQLDRAQRLNGDHAIAQGDFEGLQSAQRVAEAEVRSAAAQMQTARLNLEYTQVKAPVSGRIGRVEVTTGNLIAAGPSAPTLTTLVSVSPIYASFNVDEEAIDRAVRAAPKDALGHPSLDRVAVQMQTIGQERPLQGRLQLVDNQVNPGSGTVRVRAVFDNRDGTLMPGQFAHVRMSEAVAQDAVLVSERALASDQDRKYVLVVGQDNKVSYRRVTLGAVVNGMRVVTSGLKAKERVVLDGIKQIREGTVVSPQLAATNPEATTSNL